MDDDGIYNTTERALEGYSEAFKWFIGCFLLTVAIWIYTLMVVI